MNPVDEVLGKLKVYVGPTGVYYRKISHAGLLAGTVSLVIEFEDDKGTYILLSFNELKSLITPTEELEKSILTKDNRKSILLF